jgi:inner membrane transporter RhtA
VLGVAWFRIASAALVFAPITRPWRLVARVDRRERLLLVAMGACLALMNCCFYLALARLPISLVATRPDFTMQRKQPTNESSTFG